MVSYRCPICGEMVTPDGRFTPDLLSKPCRNCQLGHRPSRPRVPSKAKNTGKTATRVILAVLIVGGTVTLLIGLAGSLAVAVAGGIVLGFGFLMLIVSLRDRDQEIFRN